MLVFFRKDGDLKVAQVMMGATDTKVDIFDKNIEDAHPSHRGMLEKMKEDQIFVTGNSSVMGNGIFLDNALTNITGIKSRHPKIFNPINPEFVPGREELDKKYQKEWRDFVGSMRRERQELVQGGVSKEDLAIYDASMDEADERKFQETRASFREESSKLKSYKELGLIVEPICIEKYDGHGSLSFAQDNDNDTSTRVENSIKVK